MPKVRSEQLQLQLGGPVAECLRASRLNTVRLCQNFPGSFKGFLMGFAWISSAGRVLQSLVVENFKISLPAHLVC